MLPLLSSPTKTGPVVVAPAAYARLVATNAWKSVRLDGRIIVSIVRHCETLLLPNGRPVTSMRVIVCPRPVTLVLGG